MAHCCGCRSRGKRVSSIDLSGRSRRISHGRRDGECSPTNRITIFSYWGGNRIGYHRRKPRAVVAVGARRIGGRGSHGERQPSNQRLVCSNRNRRWGLRRKWGYFLVIDHTSYRHCVFRHRHSGGWITIAGYAVRPDRGGGGECVSIRDVAVPLFNPTSSQRVWQSFVRSSTSCAVRDALHRVSVFVFRRASQSRVRSSVLPGRNAARSRADCIDKLCGEGAVKTLTTNRLWVVNHIDNLLHKIEGNHHGR